MPQCPWDHTLDFGYTLMPPRNFWSWLEKVLESPSSAGWIRRVEAEPKRKNDRRSLRAWHLPYSRAWHQLGQTFPDPSLQFEICPTWDVGFLLVTLMTFGRYGAKYAWDAWVWDICTELYHGSLTSLIFRLFFEREIIHHFPFDRLFYTSWATLRILSSMTWFLSMKPLQA